jgi:glycosyltransferase 2 family protein
MRALRSVGGVILLALLLYFLNWKESLLLLLNADPLPIILVVFLFPITVLISSIKWWMLLRIQHAGASLVSLFRYYWIGSFISNFLPSSVGGDVSRLMFFRKSGHLAQVAASIIVERLTGLAMLVVLCVVALIGRPDYFDSYGLLPLLWCLVVGCAVLLLLVFRVGAGVSALLERLLRGRGDYVQSFRVKLEKVIGAALYYRGKSNVLAGTLVLSILFYAVVFFGQYLILIALGAQFPLLKVFFVAPIVSLVSLIPLFPGGIGIAEGACVFFYTQAGLLPAEALALAVMGRFLLILLSSIGGLLLIFERRAERSDEQTLI